MTFVPPTKSLAPCRPESTDRPAEPWRGLWIRTAAVAGVGLAALIAVFHDAAASAVRIWYVSPTFNHCFLILPISGYLVWQRRALLTAAPPRPDWLALAALPVLALGWLLGHVSDVLIVQQFALVAMIQAFVVTVIGRRAAWTIAFPLFYLVFAVPFGTFLVPELQDVTAAITVKVLRTIGVPVFIDGVFMTTPSGQFEVAAACSGARFLIAMIALGSLFANLYLRSAWRRAAFVGLSVVVPVIGNGLRAFGIVYLAYLTDNRLAAGVDHLVYGWIFFLVLMVALLAIGFRMRESFEATAPPVAGRRGGEGRGVVAAAALALGLAAIAPGYAALIERGPVDVAAPRLALPETVGGWRLLHDHREDWSPRYASADARALATYAKGDELVHLFVAYYARQRQGAEVVSERNTLDGGGWQRTASGVTSVTLAGRTVRTRWERMLGNGLRSRLVWSWIWLDGRFVADPFRAKILETEAKLFGRSSAGAAVAIAADFEDTREPAVAALEDFLSDFDSVGRLLAEAGGTR